MSDVVNDKVKFRERWRPFALSILAECAGITLLRQLTRRSWSWRSMCARNAATRSPPLSTTATMTRPHTVRRDVNPLFWRLIDGFRRRTGVPGVLNTSFNVKGEAIVCSPTDAVRCFYGTGLDALAIGSFSWRKRRRTPTS